MHHIFQICFGVSERLSPLLHWVKSMDTTDPTKVRKLMDLRLKRRSGCVDSVGILPEIVAINWCIRLHTLC